MTQFYQGVTSGGSEQRFRYGSKLNCFLGADTGKLGLWEGGRIDSHIIDWQFGQNSIADAVAFSPVNMAMMTPTTDPSFAITSLTYTHELAGGWVFQAGRTNAFDLWTGFYPGYGIGLDGFMNFATRIPVAVQPSLSLISNAVGVIKEGERGAEFALFVLEAQNSPTTIGLEYPNGVEFLGALKGYTDFFNKPGSHGLYGIYATGDYTSFDEKGFIELPGGGVVPGTKQGSWMAAYVGEQQLWADRCDKDRNVNLFYYVAGADNDTSPFSWSWTASLEVFKPFKGRPGDRAGIAYLYTSLHSEFQNLAAAITPFTLTDVHGGEFYYNAEITPWFHLTFDFQAIRPEIKGQDTAVVLGTRAKIDF